MGVSEPRWLVSPDGREGGGEGAELATGRPDGFRGWKLMTRAEWSARLYGRCDGPDGCRRKWWYSKPCRRCQTPEVRAEMERRVRAAWGE